MECEILGTGTGSLDCETVAFQSHICAGAKEQVSESAPPQPYTQTPPDTMHVTPSDQMLFATAIQATQRVAQEEAVPPPGFQGQGLSLSTVLAAACPFTHPPLEQG